MGPVTSMLPSGFTCGYCTSRWHSSRSELYSNKGPFKDTSGLSFTKSTVLIPFADTPTCPWNCMRLEKNILTKEEVIVKGFSSFLYNGWTYSAVVGLHEKEKDYFLKSVSDVTCTMLYDKGPF